MRSRRTTAHEIDVALPLISEESPLWSPAMVRLDMRLINERVHAHLRATVKAHHSSTQPCRNSASYRLKSLAPPSAAEVVRAGLHHKVVLGAPVEHRFFRPVDADAHVDRAARGTR